MYLVALKIPTDECTVKSRKNGFRSTIFTALGESFYNPHKSCRKGLHNYIKRGHNGAQSRCRNGDAKI